MLFSGEGLRHPLLIVMKKMSPNTYDRTLRREACHAHTDRVSRSDHRSLSHAPKPLPSLLLRRPRPRDCVAGQPLDRPDRPPAGDPMYPVPASSRPVALETKGKTGRPGLETGLFWSHSPSSHDHFFMSNSLSDLVFSLPKYLRGSRNGKQPTNRATIH